MFSKILAQTSIETCSGQIKRLKSALNAAEAVVVGAGSGLSTSAGLTYSGERFEKNFRDFMDKYGIQDMYSGGFYPFEDSREYWAWWSRQIMLNRYEKAPKPTYDQLLALLDGKDYFVLTTNVDHQFQLAGFDKKRLFYTQGDYGLWQCSQPCCQQTYDNESAIRRMAVEQQNMRIPTELIPKCPRCGRPMAMNLRMDNTFVQDAGWYAARSRYVDFLSRHERARVLFLELGVGYHTPVIIKYPFWRMTEENHHAIYASINSGGAACPTQLKQQSICLEADIGEILSAMETAS